MPPWLISVPRPGTTVVEKPFEVITRTGRSTGSRFQRRVLPRLVFAGEDIDKNHRSSRPILTDYLGEPALRAEGQHYARRADVQLDNASALLAPSQRMPTAYKSDCRSLSEPDFHPHRSYALHPGSDLVCRLLLEKKIRRPPRSSDRAGF